MNANSNQSTTVQFFINNPHGKGNNNNNNTKAGNTKMHARLSYNMMRLNRNNIFNNFYHIALILVGLVTLKYIHIQQFNKN